MRADGTLDRVLVLRLSSVGDVVLSEPVVAALRDAAPGAEIGFATKARYADLLNSHPAVTRLHVLRESPGAMAALIREVRACRYSAVVDLHANVRTARLARAAGAPVTTRYVKRSRRDALTVRLLHRSFRASRLLVQRYLDALGPLGVDTGYRRPRLFLSSADEAAAGLLLERAGLASSSFAAVAPGSVWPTKRWPAERFSEVVRGLDAEHGLRSVLVGSAAERELCGRVARSVGASAVNLAGETTLGGLAAVVARARLFVGNDSGPMHMAMALGVPTVAVFGPTDPGQFCWDGHAFVYEDLPCSACSFYGGRRCRLGHWDCMRLIASDRVLLAVSRLLSGGSGT